MTAALASVAQLPEALAHTPECYGLGSGQGMCEAINGCFSLTSMFLSTHHSPAPFPFLSKISKYVLR